MNTKTLYFSLTLDWHLITGCHLCVSSTFTSDNTETLFLNMTLAVELDVKHQF